MAFVTKRHLWASTVVTTSTVTKLGYVMNISWTYSATKTCTKTDISWTFPEHIPRQAQFFYHSVATNCSHVTLWTCTRRGRNHDELFPSVLFSFFKDFLYCVVNALCFCKVVVPRSSRHERTAACHHQMNWIRLPLWLFVLFFHGCEFQRYFMIFLDTFRCHFILLW